MLSETLSEADFPLRLSLLLPLIVLPLELSPSWVPDSCHGEAGRSLRKLFEEVRVSAV